MIDELKHRLQPMVAVVATPQHAQHQIQFRWGEPGAIGIRSRDEGLRIGHEPFSDCEKR